MFGSSRMGVHSANHDEFQRFNAGMKDTPNTDRPANRLRPFRHTVKQVQPLAHLTSACSADTSGLMIGGPLNRKPRGAHPHGSKRSTRATPLQAN